MAFRLSRSIVLIGITVFALGNATSCGSKAGKTLQALLCSRGEAKNQMTVGFDLGLLKGLLGGSNLRSSEAVSDDEVKDYLNKTLAPLNTNSDFFSVKKVESVVPDDKVRFLEVGGTFGDLFGAGADILKKAFASSALKSMTGNPLEFVSESFGVKAADAVRIYYRDRVHQIAESLLPESIYHRLADIDTTKNEDQWALRQTDYEAALTLFQEMYAKNKERGENLENPVIVAVLDTGANRNHPDLKDILVDGYNASGEGEASAWDDANGHGTHCSGIIAARKTSDQSPIGVATMANVKIMPVKVLGDSGSGGFQAIEKGIRYAMAHGAEVISMSLGAGMEYEDAKKQGSLVNQVMEEAIAKGIIFVIAAGNESCPLGGQCEQSGSIPLSKSKFNEYTVLPCAYEHSLCVGATNADETLAVYSNYSSQKDETSYRTKVDVNAPGTAIYSTWIDKGGPYKTISGTSMATPYIAGIAAILKSVDKSINQADMIQIMQKGQVYPDEIKEKSGEGRVDLLRTLQYVASTRLAVEHVDYKEDENAPPAPVDAPEVADDSALNAVGDLWGSVCQ